MATYNGGRFLTMQLDSIMGQTYQDWHLYVHDDGSSDETTEILQKYEQEHHKDISILHYPPQGGSCSNFLSLLERVDAKYYMFADQDDIWHIKKIEKSMVIMHKMEQIHPDIPIIIHSNLRIIDEHQTTLHNPTSTQNKLSDTKNTYKILLPAVPCSSTITQRHAHSPSLSLMLLCTMHG